ncbi:hypothetical protein GCM10010335_45300 [Streptomyces galbus]|nr:hypothetical protein GCM10010335_45300 [Streptomyces galbus]
MAALENASLRPVIDHSYPIDELPHGLDCFDSGAHLGKASSSSETPGSVRQGVKRGPLASAGRAMQAAARTDGYSTAERWLIQ